MTGGSRFVVEYEILAHDPADALSRAEAAALEQTVEIPRDIVPLGYIEDVILGRVEDIHQREPDVYSARISYSPDCVGPADLTQLLNVIFGNSSLQCGIKTVGLDLDESLRGTFPGARFGIKGVRVRAGRATGGLLAPVIKPVGSSVETLADIAYRCALAGADIIKEDHGLANQPAAPFRKRCERIAAAVQRANHETGRSTLYFPNLSGSYEGVIENAHFAKDAGAGGLLVMPGLLGFGLIYALASNPSIDLPIMAHPSFLGPHVLSADAGFTHAMMFAYLQRLAGTDISIFPNVAGRFSFTRAECLSIAAGCRDQRGVGRPIAPSPGGGMSPDRVAEMDAMYGPDVVYLLGGSLLRHGDRIGDTIRDIRRLLDSRHLARA